MNYAIIIYKEEVMKLAGSKSIQGYLEFVIHPAVNEPFKKTSNPETELTRFHNALESAKKKIVLTKKSIDANLESLQNVIHFHELAMDDPDLIARVKDYILNAKLTAEAAVMMYFNQLIDMYQTKNDFFRARTVDFIDIRNRIVNALKYPFVDSLTDKQIFSRPTILVYDIVYPNELTQIDFANIVGVISLRGSLHSHVSIVLKSLNIPFLVGLNSIKQYHSGQYVRITMENALIELTNESCDDLLSNTDLDEESNLIDNVFLHPALNLVQEIPSEIPAYWSSVGLFRTEFIFMDKPYLPDEIEQYLIYQDICEKAKGIRVNFRLIDVEPDKLLPSVESALFGIDLLLKHESLLKDQLRALLEISVKYPIGIIVPMIENQEQINHILHTIRFIINEEHYNQSLNYRFGIMVERRTAVENFEMLDGFDFILIGTNDLTADYSKLSRDNLLLKSHHYLNSELLSDINELIRKTKLKKTDIILCGDAANDQDSIEVYRLMGIQSFAPSPKNYFLYQKTK